MMDARGRAALLEQLTSLRERDRFRRCPASETRRREVAEAIQKLIDIVIECVPNVPE